MAIRLFWFQTHRTQTLRVVSTLTRVTTLSQLPHHPTPLASFCPLSDHTLILWNARWAIVRPRLTVMWNATLEKQTLFVPPITVSTQPRTFDDSGNVASGGLRLKDVKNLEGLEEAENVDQHQSQAGSRFGSQDPAETAVGNVQDSI